MEDMVPCQKHRMAFGGCILGDIVAVSAAGHGAAIVFGKRPQVHCSNRILNGRCTVKLEGKAAFDDLPFSVKMSIITLVL